MKITMKRFICIVLCLVTVFSLATVGAFAMDQVVYKNKFWNYLDSKGLSPSADGATNMVYAARATIGMTGTQLGAGGDWCAAHISTLAKTVKQSDAIPYNAGVKYLYNNIKKAGGTVIYSRYGVGNFNNAKPGDIVVYRLNGVDYAHVELVSKKPVNGKITSIGGNTGNDNWKKSVVKEHSWNKSYVAYIIRPAYKNSALTYLDRCQKTATYVNLSAVNSTDYIMTLPCSNRTDSSSQAVRRISYGEKFLATAIIKNSEGNYWYRIKSSKDNKTGYIYAGCVKYTGVPTDVVSGNAKLATYTPKKGKAVTISGTVTSSTKIVSVTGTLKGTGSTQTAKVSVNAKTFTIKGSKIDSGLKFGKLGKGAGYVQLTVIVSVPYIDNNKLVNNTKTITLSPVNFTVK